MEQLYGFLTENWGLWLDWLQAAFIRRKEVFLLIFIGLVLLLVGWMIASRLVYAFINRLPGMKYLDSGDLTQPVRIDRDKVMSLFKHHGSGFWLNALALLLIVKFLLSISGISHIALEILLNSLVLGVVVIMALRILDTISAIYELTEDARKRPITHYIQAFKLLVYLLAIVSFIALVLDLSLSLVLGGLGAASAVILFMFQETISGLIGGITLFRNGLVQKGDWLIMPEHEVDGEVYDINIFSLRVLNWNGVLVVVPFSQLMKQSFQNYSYILGNNVRRIQRCLYLDPTSIALLDQTALQAFYEIPLLRPYLQRKEIEWMNQGITASATLNNLTLYRQYIEAYLRSIPLVNQNKLLLVRQMPSTTQGILPVEVAVFINEANTAMFDPIQSEIFEHLFAMAPQFSIRLYTPPNTQDLSDLKDKESSKATSTLAKVRRAKAAKALAASES